MSADDVMSTRDVAQLLGVSEATVKRWSDEQHIPCQRTPGGHRKFRRSEVNVFARTLQFAEPEALPSLSPEQVIAVALKGQARPLHRLLRKAVEGGLPLCEVLDVHVGPALLEVGERWACAGMSVAEEHLVSTVVCDALARLGDDYETGSARGTAVVGCLTGERHDIGSRMASVVLRAQGYRVLMTGADTPAADLAKLAKAHGATLVALSAVHPINRPEEALDIVLEELRDRPIRVVLGGPAFTRLPALPTSAEFAPDMRTFEQLLVAMPAAIGA